MLGGGQALGGLEPRIEIRLDCRLRRRVRVVVVDLLQNMTDFVSNYFKRLKVRRVLLQRNHHSLGV